MSDEIRKLLQARRLASTGGDSSGVGIEQVGPREPRSPYNAQLLKLSPEDALQPGKKGGALRPAIKKERNTIHGKPPPTERLRINKHGDVEVYDPLAEWEARDNRT
jgi:hypothetical protein